jgi:hypothetical protein
MRHALVAALALLAAAPAAAQSHRGGDVPLPPPPPGTVLLPRAAPPRPDNPAGLEAAALLGVSNAREGGDGTNPLVRGELALPLGVTPAGLGVSLVLPVRSLWLRPRTIADVEVSGLQVEVTPSARLTVPLRRAGATVRVDAGAGYAWSRVATKEDVAFVGRVTTVETSTAAVARAALSVALPLGPALTVVVEPVSFGFDFHGGADWTVAAGCTLHR